jgi:hypothetical protein
MKYSWYSFLLETESTTRAVVRSEELCQRKNPMTPSGSEPATFRFVAQNLNHCATAVPESREVQQITSRRTFGCTWPHIQLLLEKRVQGVKLTTLVWRLELSGAAPPLRHTPSRPGHGQPSFNTCRTEPKKLSEPKISQRIQGLFLDLRTSVTFSGCNSLYINPFSAELNLICHLLTLLGAHHIFHVSKLRVKYTLSASRVGLFVSNMKQATDKKLRIQWLSLFTPVCIILIQHEGQFIAINSY